MRLREIRFNASGHHIVADDDQNAPQSHCSAKERHIIKNLNEPHNWE